MNNDYEIIQFFKLRMQQMGYCRYYYEHFYLQLNRGLTNYKAFNEYFYLRTPEVNDIEIVSDTGYFNSNVRPRSNMYEFSANIEVTRLAPAAPAVLEFFRVVPLY